jgi:hypothetical protein
LRFGEGAEGEESIMVRKIKFQKSTLNLSF